MKFPKILEVQFHNYCNANCSICPYEQYSLQTPLKKMDLDLKEKILNEIATNKDKIERIIPYFNNEPFIDKEFIQILRWFKNNVPDIPIEVSTNLSIFNADIMSQVIKEQLIDDFRISFFGGSSQTYKQMMPKLHFERNLKNLQSFLDLRKTLNTKFQYEIIMVLLPNIDIVKEQQSLQSMITDEKLRFHFFGYLDRAGTNEVKNKKIVNDQSSYYFNGCSLKRNEERLCIDINGNIPLCSQDWFLKEKIGSVRTSSISEVWNSKRKIEIDRIISGELPPPKSFLCKDCKLIYLKDQEGIRLNFEGDRYMNNLDQKKTLQND